MQNQNYILDSTVYHKRLYPTVHEFSYKLFYFSLDLHKIKERQRKALFFSYNNTNLLSIFESDYLSHLHGDLLKKIQEVCKSQGIKGNFSYVRLISHPRFLGYVFNPVSFFLCYRPESEFPEVIVSEVHNTFGEKHVYVSHQKELNIEKRRATYSSKKEFHVSPFFDLQGHYEFTVNEIENKFTISIDYYKGDKLVFKSGIASKKKILDSRSVSFALVRYPLGIVMTFPRIVWQAFLLKFKRRLSVYTKPIARSDMTFEVRDMSFIQKLLYRLFCKHLNKVQKGSLVVDIGGKQVSFEGKEKGVDAHIRILNNDFYAKCIFGGDIGFGEAFVKNFWDTDDLTNVIRFFSQNLQNMDDKKIVWSYFLRGIEFLKHASKHNSKRNTSHNISAHYDLSNDLFQTFLDPKLQYSSAYFKSKEDSLEQAQLNKINRIIEVSHITSTDRVLEIGCGWGELAIELVKRVGCRYVGVTLSKEQKSYFESRVKEEGLEDLITIELKDYREITGEYDKIISIEMIEAVGPEYLEDYFSLCEGVLTAGGKLLIQAITIPDNRYESYKKGCDWIQKYIFPGGHCPSLGAIRDASSKTGTLHLNDTFDLTASYADTLTAWRKKFFESLAHIKQLGFDDRFIKMWHYYLAYCEAGFTENVVNTYQISFTKK